jgi:hypothetical protein
VNEDKVRLSNTSRHAHQRTSGHKSKRLIRTSIGVAAMTTAHRERMLRAAKLGKTGL